MDTGITAKVKAENTGRANVEKLIRQKRLVGYDNPFDPVPNPDRGHAMDPKTGMRVGLSPAVYLSYVKKDLDNPARPSCLPRLTPEEKKVMDDFAKDEKSVKSLPEELKPALAAYLGK